MPESFDYPQLDPKAIVRRRESRQRSELKLDDGLKESIKVLGILNPIIVRRPNGGPAELVAGERRLQAALELQMPLVPVRFFDTLTETECQIVEAEENLKRSDLPWRDQVRAITKIHALCLSQDPNWKSEQTAARLSISDRWIRTVLQVHASLGSNKLDQATSIEQAYNILVRLAERKAEAIVSEIIAGGKVTFGDEEATVTASPTPQMEPPQPSLDALDDGPALPPTVSPPPPAASALAPPPIICADFTEWIKLYSGRKFNLLHVDFPYGNYKGDDSAAAQNLTDSEDFYDNTEDVYWRLLDALTANLDRVMSYSAHMIFWMNMNFYERTRLKLSSTGLFVHEHPLIWFKTDGKGVVPGNAVTHPRRVYDTAFLCVRGQRPLANPGSNGYGAPTVSNKIHPSQKSEPMLRHFMSMLVDETTTVFDPTAGSGAALRVAEDLGAAAILGLELDPAHAKSANDATIRARLLRSAGR